MDIVYLQFLSAPNWGNMITNEFLPTHGARNDGPDYYYVPRHSRLIATSNFLFCLRPPGAVRAPAYLRADKAITVEPHRNSPQAAPTVLGRYSSI